MNLYIPKFRRIEDVLKEIKETDPDTELNWRFIIFWGIFFVVE